MGRCLLLLLLLAGCAPRADELSPQAAELWGEYRALNEWNPPADHLRSWLAERGASVEELQRELLSPSEGESKLREDFYNLQRKLLQHREAEMLQLRQRVQALPRAVERDYLLSVLGYWGLNLLLAGADRELQTKSLLSLRDRLSPWAGAESASLDTKMVGTELADAHRLYAEVCGRLMSFQPQRVMILSAEMKEHAEHAVHLDANNGAAWLTLGTWYLFAPDFSGGSVKLALRAFGHADRTQLTTSERVLLIEFKARALAKRGDVEAALAELERGLQLAPAHLNYLVARDRLQQGLPFS